MIGVTCPRCKQQWFRDDNDTHKELLCPACAGGRVGDVPSAFLSAVGAALDSWAFVIPATMLSGLWLGASVGLGRPASPQAVLGPLICPLVWIFFLPVLIAFSSRPTPGAWRRERDRPGSSSLSRPLTLWRGSP